MKKKYVIPRLETVGGTTAPFMELMSYHNAIGGPQLGKQTDGWDFNSDFESDDDFDFYSQSSSTDSPFQDYQSWNN